MYIYIYKKYKNKKNLPLLIISNTEKLFLLQVKLKTLKHNNLFICKRQFVQQEEKKLVFMSLPASKFYIRRLLILKKGMSTIKVTNHHLAPILTPSWSFQLQSLCHLMPYMPEIGKSIIQILEITSKHTTRTTMVQAICYDKYEQAFASNWKHNLFMICQLLILSHFKWKELYLKLKKSKSSNTSIKKRKKKQSWNQYHPIMYKTTKQYKVYSL